MECIARYDFKASRPDELSFKENDVLTVIIDPKKGQEEDWAMAELRGRKGMIPKNYIITPEWFYRGLSRQQAEQILMDGQPDGAFLIRDSESSRGDFSLSVKYGEGVQHFKILFDTATAKVFLWQAKFDTINLLVNYFRSHSVSRTNDRVLLKDMMKKGVAKCSTHGGGLVGNGVASIQSAAQISGGRAALQPVSRAKIRVKALYDFEPEDNTELRLRADDTVEVIDSSDQNWWQGRLRGKTGLFPRTYVQIL